MRVAHGIAHQILHSHAEPYNEADVWWLTMFLLIPWSDVHDSTAWEVEQRAHAPRWFVGLAMALFRAANSSDPKQSLTL